MVIYLRIDREQKVKHVRFMRRGNILGLIRRVKYLLIALLLSVYGQMTVCAQPTSQPAPINVGFLLVGSVSDWGFNYAHNQGRLYLEKTLGNRVHTIMAEKIPESAEAERVLERMISQNCRLIFTTSYGYLEPVMRVSTRHPDVIFMQINQDYTSKNIGNYFSHQYQPMYLAGIVAGRMTKTNKLGFIAAHPVPPLMQAINSFMLGARSVNAKVETRVIFINNWTDPPMEAEAVKALVEGGCDVVAHAQDNSNTVLKACEKLGVYSCGFYTDAHQIAPKGWLTGACLDWGPFYVRLTESVINHTWKPVSYRQGMEGGYIKLSSFGQAVPLDVQKDVLAKENLIKSGKLIIFKGPLKDSRGKERYAAGHIPTLSELARIDWFVPGVTGTAAGK